MSTATLEIFSGLPNPKWSLDAPTVQHLQMALTTFHTVANLDKPVPTLPDSGYRGITVALDARGTPPQQVLVYGGEIFVNGQVKIDPNRQVETLLLRESPFLKDLGVTPDEITMQVAPSLIQGIVGEEAEPACRNSPSFPSSPAIWNVPANNCYSYANDERNTNPLFAGAQPGGGSPLTEGGLIAGAVSDGLVHLGKHIPTACPAEADAHFVAICLLHTASGKLKDYHCLRLDKSGVWSHKLGPPGTPTNIDQAHASMADIRSVKLRWNPVLVGFFRSVEGVRHLTFSG